MKNITLIDLLIINSNNNKSIVTSISKIYLVFSHVESNCKLTLLMINFKIVYEVILYQIRRRKRDVGTVYHNEESGRGKSNFGDKFRIQKMIKTFSLIFIGESQKAELILKDFQHRNPGYSSIELRLLAIQRRRIQRAKSDKGDFTGVISKYERLMQDIDCPKRLSSFYALKLARLHLKVKFFFI